MHRLPLTLAATAALAGAALVGAAVGGMASVDRELAAATAPAPAVAERWQDVSSEVRAARSHDCPGDVDDIPRSEL